MTMTSDLYANDLEVTRRNHARLEANKNLLYWYRELYKDQFRHLKNFADLTVLEIGSGVSPLARFHPTVRTSDVLELDYLDYIFDCHQLDEYEMIPNDSLDVITLTNVLHHLRSPIEFLTKAARKIKPGGLLIATEPYFSLLSWPLYKFLHHEPVDFSITMPELSEIRGPLASANEALPWLIFHRNEWRRQIEEFFEFEPQPFRPFTALAYFMTGGISRRFPIPRAVYRVLFALDLAISRWFPRVAASFFTITLTRK